MYDGLIDDLGFWKRDIRSDLAALYNSGNGLAYPFVSSDAGLLEAFIPRQRSRTPRRQFSFLTDIAGPVTTDCGLIEEDAGAILTESGAGQLALEGCPVADAFQPESVILLPTRRRRVAVPYQ